VALSRAGWSRPPGRSRTSRAAAIAWLLLRGQGKHLSSWRYFLWLFTTLNLLQGTGYWLFSGVGNVGDWAQLVAGLEPHWLYRVLLALLGGASYWAAIVLGLRTLNPLLGDGPDRLERARTLCLVPYLAGGALYVAAGALNPVSPLLVLISAAAASFGGVSAFAWMTQMLRGPGYPPATGEPLVIDRSVVWARRRRRDGGRLRRDPGPGVGILTPEMTEIPCLAERDRGQNPPRSAVPRSRRMRWRHGSGRRNGRAAGRSARSAPRSITARPWPRRRSARASGGVRRRGPTAPARGC
jgi:hypothetical protein